ncbi:MAG: winged helix-turn-helix transcriptional regulator [Desulfovibrionaceae bacterium]|jgi:DNA-binding MarR family transcriptional regulator|nr:winged helix-turn-helix transcriptional regulator [Desulfovibrionaceae bacterium]
MIVNDRVFYKPSRQARQLAVLDLLARGASGAGACLTQQGVGERTGLSGGMVNQYLRELQRDGLIEFEPVNGKSFRYLLTPEGEALRERLFADYSAETTRIYTALKDSIREKLRPLAERGLTRIAVFGAWETGEVTLTALRGTPFVVVAVLDNDRAKHGTLFLGHPVSPPEVLATVRCDAVVIASFGGREAIYKQLRPLAEARGMEIVRL